MTTKAAQTSARKTVPELTISNECKYCAEGEPEWSPDAKCWIHRRAALDKRCTRKVLGSRGEMPAAAGPEPLVSANEPRFTCKQCGSSVAESWREKHVCAKDESPSAEEYMTASVPLFLDCRSHAGCPPECGTQPTGSLSDIREEPQGLEARVKFWRERSNKLAAMWGTMEQANRELLEALEEWSRGHTITSPTTGKPMECDCDRCQRTRAAIADARKP